MTIVRSCFNLYFICIAIGTVDVVYEALLLYVVLHLYRCSTVVTISIVVIVVIVFGQYRTVQDRTGQYSRHRDLYGRYMFNPRFSLFQINSSAEFHIA